MKKLTILTSIFFFCAVIVFTASSFKVTPVKTNSETCSEWAGYGIQFRQCVTDWGSRSFQFFNGYRFEVEIYATLTYESGATSLPLTIFMDADTASDKGSTSNSENPNNKVVRWTVLKKQRKNDEGRMVEF